MLDLEDSRAAGIDPTNDTLAYKVKARTIHLKFLLKDLRSFSYFVQSVLSYASDWLTFSLQRCDLK